MDSYSLCPCGSGKKVKFCCQAILPEMAKIERLQENNQPRMALQIIDKLLKDNQENAWLVNQRAMSLMADERHEEARDSLVALLRKTPDHPLANALLALVMTELESMPQCKKVIHRAFLKSMTAEPRVAAVLAGKLVDHFLNSGKEMAARQHMAVVLRLESEKQRQQTLVVMLEFDSDASIPYPLRGAHPLPQYSPSESTAAQFKKAQRLYLHACFAEAADILDQLVEQDPNSAELHHTIGLMRAWDGDEARAAVALHRAAELYQDKDQERAVDVETIAQLLQRRQGNVVYSKIRSYEVESLSRLLTRLDNEDRLHRAVLMDQPEGSRVSAAYDILDRPVPSAAELENATLETIPRAIGHVTLYDSVPGAPAHLDLNAIEGERFDQADRILVEASGDLIKRCVEDGEVEEDETFDAFSVEELALSENAFFPPQTPPAIRNELRKQFITESVKQLWLDTPLAALGGRTPQQAASDSSAKVSLLAALRVFDSFIDRRGVMLDQVSLREKLQLPQESTLTLEEGQDLNAFSIPQLLRLEITSLPDETYNRVMQRGIVSKHCGLAYRLFSEFVNNRPELMKDNYAGAEQAFLTLSELCSRSMRDEEAYEWIRRGFAYTEEHGKSFESLLMWKLREVSLRARNTDDPEFRNVLLDVWNNYGSKLPAVRARLEEFVQTLNIDAPWENAILTPQTAGLGEKAVWGAETEETSSAGKKLWLPD